MFKMFKVSCDYTAGNDMVNFCSDPMPFAQADALATELSLSHGDAYLFSTGFLSAETHYHNGETVED